MQAPPVWMSTAAWLRSRRVARTSWRSRTGARFGTRAVPRSALARAAPVRDRVGEAGLDTVDDTLLGGDAPQELDQPLAISRVEAAGQFGFVLGRHGRDAVDGAPAGRGQEQRARSPIRRT